MKYFHIANLSDWNSSGDDFYKPAMYEVEGFIHLSYPTQLKATFDRYYLRKPQLLLLYIECDGNTVDLKAEDLTGKGELFPHLYQPLDKSLVSHVYPIPEPDRNDEYTKEIEEFFAKVLEATVDC